jgi:C-terminal processing protease CtpA/Prc
MKIFRLPLLVFWGVIEVLTLCPSAQAQTVDFANVYVIGASLIRNNDSPVFIGGVSPLSPADRAGIRAGDRLLAVDGVEVSGLRDAGERTRSDQPGNVTLRLWRKGEVYEATVEREKNSAVLARRGLQIRPDGRIFVLEATEAEIDAQEDVFELVSSSAVEAFPQHFPTDTDLYAAGFAVVVNPDPSLLIVTGLEDGPGKRAGLREGDLILSIDGVDPRGKSVLEIENMLSGTEGRLMRLAIRRSGAAEPEKTFQFQLERTEKLLEQNHEQIVEDQLLPDWVAEEELHWFLNPEQQ